VPDDGSTEIALEDQKNMILYRKVPNCMTNMIPKAIYPISLVSYRPALKVREIKESWIKLLMHSTLQSHIDKKVGGDS
jgi:hypothetical protein